MGFKKIKKEISIVFNRKLVINLTEHLYGRWREPHLSTYFHSGYIEIFNQLSNFALSGNTIISFKTTQMSKEAYEKYNAY